MKREIIIAKPVMNWIAIYTDKVRQARQLNIPYFITSLLSSPVRLILSKEKLDFDHS